MFQLEARVLLRSPRDSAFLGELDLAKLRVESEGRSRECVDNNELTLPRGIPPLESEGSGLICDFAYS